MTFDDEFDELAALAYQTAFRILGSRHEAEEVAQDTMTKAYLRWRKGFNATPAHGSAESLSTDRSASCADADDTDNSTKHMPGSRPQSPTASICNDCWRR